jgi:adenosyl cobinamide kinase/adenosyl cobinamide phosphate guanylyltransferase
LDDVSGYLVGIFESINDLENEVLELKNENDLLKNSHVIISNNLGLEVIHNKELETKYNGKKRKKLFKTNIATMIKQQHQFSLLVDTLSTSSLN